MPGRTLEFRNPQRAPPAAESSAKAGAPLPRRTHHPHERYCQHPRSGFSRCTSDNGLNLFRAEKKAVAWLTDQSQVSSRIFVEHDGQMRLALVVLFDTFDNGGLRSEEHTSE